MLRVKINPQLIVYLLIISFGFSSCQSLEKVSIANLRLEYDKQQLRLRGTSLPIGISVITNDQKRLRTRGFSGGNLKWSNFLVSVEGGSYSNGKILIPKDSPSDTLLVKIVSKHHPEWELREVIWLNHLLNIRADAVEPVVWAPDEAFRMNLEAYYDNGQAYTNKLNEKLIKQMGLMVKTEGGMFSGSKFRIFEDFRQIPMHTVSLRLESQSNPNVSDLFIQRLTYIKNYDFTQSVTSAWTGRSGSDGSSGSSGGGDGGHGHHGTDGEDGYNGDNGINGLDLNVFVDAYADSLLQTDLVYVEVTAPGSTTKHFLINPNGGSIAIRTFGGNGGSGGNGGNGGSGGSGGNGKETVTEYKDSTGVHRTVHIGHGGHGGAGGNGGNGGVGGNGGRGGDIFIHYTENAKSYLHIVNAQSIGGSSGSGGTGGSAGSGGSGGSGHPDGSSGRSGNSGQNGSSGYGGPDGEIIYVLVND